LAPLITQELFEVIAQLNRETSLSVLLVEQNANLALKIAQRAYVLETGRIVASGTSAELSADDTVRKAYLGF
jgi:branched-chain amino acid transport system ATP-binding protein